MVVFINAINFISTKWVMACLISTLFTFTATKLLGNICAVKPEKEKHFHRQTFVGREFCEHALYGTGSGCIRNWITRLIGCIIILGRNFRQVERIHWFRSRLESGRFTRIRATLSLYLYEPFYIYFRRFNSDKCFFLCLQFENVFQMK